MNRRTRAGFTLVELLVVITIIGMLVAMLVPAVGAIQEQARLTQCRNNIHNLQLAAASYEASRGKYPPYFFISVGNNGSKKTFSWVVALFPYIGENTLYKKWVEKDETPEAYLAFMVCPSDPPETTFRSPASYKANLLVLSEPSYAIDPDPEKLEEPRPYSSERVNNADGAQYTLLFSEDLLTYLENPDDPESEVIQRRWDRTDPGKIETELCFSGGGSLKDHLGSKHSAGVVVALVAGNVRTISDDISDIVYQALVTPDGGEHIDEDMLR